MGIYDINNNLLLDAVIKENAEHVEELSKSNYVKLSWLDNSYKRFSVGTYIIPFDDGIKYSLIDPYIPVQQSEDTFLYEPEFQHPKMWLSKVQLTYKTKNVLAEDVELVEWEYNGFTISLLEYIAKAINDAFNFTTDDEKFNVLLIGNVDDTVAVNFSSNDILSALSSVSNACKVNKCEWHIDFDNKAIYFGQICYDKGELVTPILKVGKNISKPNINIAKEAYYNVFFPQGSTRNMSTKVASGENVSTSLRLSLDKDKYPDGRIYIDSNGNIITKEDFEKSGVQKLTKSIIYDNVYPHVDCYAYNIRKKTKDIYSETTKSKVVDHYDSNGQPVYKKWSIWYMRLAYPTYDESGNITKWNDYLLNDKQILDGYIPHITFKPNLRKEAYSSSLSGQPVSGDGFQIHYHKVGEDTILDDGSKVLAGDYEIVHITQGEGGMILPTTEEIGLYPKGDKEPSINNNIVVVYNTAMGESEIKSAQNELEKETIKTIKSHLIDYNNYTIQSYPDAFLEENPRLYIGKKIIFDDSNGNRLETRVLKLVTKLDFPIQQEIVIGNQQIKGTQTQLKEDVQTIMSGNYEGAGLNVTQVKNYIRNLGGDLFLSKIKDDTVIGHITFEKGLSSNNIKSKGYSEAGSGYRIWENEDGESHADIDFLNVRKKANFTELEIRKLSAVGGDLIVSPCSATITSVEKVANGFKCFFKSDDGTMATTNGFRAGDQAKCQTFNIKSGVYKGVSNRYYWRTVEEVGRDEQPYSVANNIPAGEVDIMYDERKADVSYDLTSGELTVTDNRDKTSLDYIILSDTSKDAVGTDEPKAGDVIVLCGQNEAWCKAHNVPIDKGRQNVTIITTSKAEGGTIECYVGINSFHIGEENITLYHSPGKHIIDTSTFTWKSRGNKQIAPTVYIGDWTKGTVASKNEGYTYNGGTWLCVADKTTDEPSEQSHDWRIYAAKGGSGLRVECFSSAGSAAFTEGQTDWRATFELHVWENDIETTDTLPTTRFRWTRVSEYSAGDTAWNGAHEHIGNTLSVTYDDLKGDTSFICAFLSDGNDVLASRTF